ncbi:TonB-dependent receptor [Terriglobus saanensis]|uniref:TonB-dependent receptor n=1 Tax=Terriglobus saanensis (strain ATCC BAA-1853 / DSM 23119 / SP1PR4) TaxID=401053 RepID=E8V4C4_TERSS|nr:TonB-dependent receptor [Terriglobus saanensis]ADV83673.1 TonB-dependent receptor [Terriglobus saanensis SP1PR4]
MKAIQTLRPVLSGLAASASLASLGGGVLFVAPERADAQGTQPSQSHLSSTVRRFDIPPGPLSDVVSALERETGIHITLAIHSIGSIHSPGVSGSFTAEQALHAMLADTGIRVRVTSPTMAVVELVPASETVEVTASTNALQTTTDVGRLPDTLQSTPQTITSISQVMIEQQQATTVDQVLQYVPGITVATGEGNGGISGDQFRIRGFDASGDIYVDGLRDFGSYVRDSFATENVMVIKGPASESFGNGTTGGVIELDSKKAHLGNASSYEVTGGTGPYGRGVFDINRQLNDTTAARIVAMGNGQDVVDRDHVYSNRWGVLASVGFGLGTDQTVVVDYFHQHSDQRPDFGVPMNSGVTGVVGVPVTELGVSRKNYYGRESDRDLMDADVATILYKGHFGDWLTLTNDTRVGHYTRDLRFTPSLCLDVSPLLSYLYGIPAGTCATDVSKGNLNTNYVIWPVGGNTPKSSGAENVTTALVRFHTLGMRHELVAGVDEYYQHASMKFYTPSGTETPGTLLNPIYQNSPGFSLVLASTGTNSRSWDVGPFISDRVWLTHQLSVSGGVRWDHYSVRGNASGTIFNAPSQFASPKASLLWEPTLHQTYYFNFARSVTPSGNNITSLSTTSSILSAQSQPNLKPQGSNLYEVGGKWSLLQDRLGATAALYRLEKNNTAYTDAITGIQTTTGDVDRVQGIELGLTGKITRAWDTQASYSLMDNKIVYSAISAFTPVSAIGNRVPYVSKNGIALWTTYDVATLIPSLHGHLLGGGGFNFRSDYFVDNANSLHIPTATTATAMLSYDLERYHLGLNVNNLTNTLAYNSAFGNGYATPVAGRTFLFTFGLRLASPRKHGGF